MSRTLAFVVMGTLIGATSVPAVAADHPVGAYDDYFQPQAVTVAQGDTVTFTNHGAHDHRPLSDQGFFASYLLDPGESSQIAFRHAGTYPYHCQFHAAMTGKVRVPMRATGTPSTGWTLQWSNQVPTPSGYRFDVQIKRPGDDGFSNWKGNVTTNKAAFNPSTNGTYAFRARTEKYVVSWHASNWSPVLKVSIS